MLKSTRKIRKGMINQLNLLQQKTYKFTDFHYAHENKLNTRYGWMCTLFICLPSKYSVFCHPANS